MSWIFHRVLNWLGDIDIDNTIANYSICSRPVIDAVGRFRERNRSFPMFLFEAGFPRTTVDVEHASRYSGRSSYNFSRLFDFAIQVVVARSNKPLRISIQFGFLLAFLALAYGMVVVGRYFAYGVTVQGWTTLIVLVSFLGGLGFANLGIVGLYVGKIFDEVKRRPLYAVETTLNER